MSFFDAIKTNFRKYAEFGGRAARPEFWWFVLFTTIVSAALSFLNLRMGSGPEFGQYGYVSLEGMTSTTLFLGSSLAGFWSMAVLLPSLAVTVRRLRDAGHRWTELFWLLLPIAGLIVLIVRLAEPSVVAAPPAVPVAGGAGTS